MATITPVEAKALHKAAHARKAWIMWFVSLADPTHGQSGGVGHHCRPSGGAEPPGLLVADTLEELRTRLPAGLRG